MKITWFLSFSSKNHAESFRNFVKNLVLDPKRAKSDQNSDFGHVRTCQGQSRRPSPCQQSRFPFFFSQKLHQNSDFGHVRTCQDLSRRTSTYYKPTDIPFFCSRTTPFHFLLTNLSFFIKSCVLLNKFIMLYKNHRFY